MTAMKRISRRRFLSLSLGFVGSAILLKVSRPAGATSRPPQMMEPPRPYGMSAYGYGAYGSAQPS
jgi:hypothetical protein